MTTYTPAQLKGLVSSLIPDNVNNEIMASDARTVLNAIIDSYYNLVDTPNPTAPTLENVLLEGNTSGSSNIICDTGRYVIFQGPSGRVQVRPLQNAGNANATINLPLRSGTLALLDDIAGSTWLAPVDNELDAPLGNESEGTRLLVGVNPSGAFAGKPGQVAERVNGAWTFSPTSDGDMVRCLLDPPGVVRTKMSGIWVTPSGIGQLPTLENTLDEGNVTGPHDIIVSPARAVGFASNQSGAVARIVAPVVNDNTVLNVPTKSGTIATTDDVAAVAALVDGTMRAPEAFAPAGAYPTTYDSNPIQKGDTFRLAAGTMGGATVDAEDLLVALVDTPGQNDANWQVLESNRVVATQQEAEDQNSQDTAKLMPPKRWWQAWSKGLGLTAFLNAVRGTKLDGYSVGSDAALATGDTILGALGKVQGQLNGKLAKASNLSDLPNKETARTNLGLGFMATQEWSTNIMHRIREDHVFVNQGGNWVNLVPPVGTLLSYDADLGQWRPAENKVDGMLVGRPLVHEWAMPPTETGYAWILRRGMVELPLSEFGPDGVTPQRVWYLSTGPGPGSVSLTPNGSPVMIVVEDGLVWFDPVGLATYHGGGASGQHDVGFIQAGGNENATGTEQAIFTELLSQVVLQPGAYQFDVQFRMEMTDVGSSGENGAPTLSLYIKKNGGGVAPVYGHLTVTQQNQGVPGASGIMVNRTKYTLAEVPNGEFVDVTASGMLYFFEPCDMVLSIGTTDDDHNVRVEEFGSFTWRKLKDPV